MAGTTITLVLRGFSPKPPPLPGAGLWAAIRRAISASAAPFKAWSLTGLTAIMFMPRLTTGFSQNFKDAHEQLCHLWGMVGSIYNTRDFKPDCFHGLKCGEREIGPWSFLDPSREKYWNIGIEEFILKNALMWTHSRLYLPTKLCRNIFCTFLILSLYKSQMENFSNAFKVLSL